MFSRSINHATSPGTVGDYLKYETKSWILVTFSQQGKTHASCSLFFFFLIYIYITYYIYVIILVRVYTHVYIISYKKHEDVYIDMIYSLRCCDPCEITSQKFYTYVCTYVCASVCPALKFPAPLSIFLSSLYHLTHHSIISSLRLFSRYSLDHHRTDRSYTYDRRSLSLSFSPFIYSLPLTRVRPSGACVNVWLHVQASSFTPSIKEGIIIDTIPKNFYLNFFRRFFTILLLTIFHNLSIDLSHTSYFHPSNNIIPN